MNRTICANPCCTHPFAYLISAPVNATTPRVSGLVGSLRRANSKRICVSLTEAQYQTLNQRERELNLGRKQDLFAAATNDPRPTHVWVLVERDEPHIIGRRRTSPEMLIAGRTALDQLMAAYAKCLKTGLWPAFDPNLPGAQEAWSPFHLEPWMTQGDGGATAFFGVTNAPPLPNGN